jgi:DNA-directed RNA polymerase subunit omega
VKIKENENMDMVNPTMDELLKKVDSKYTLVVLAAKRARQLLDGAELKVTMKSTKNVTNALEEIIEDRIKYERTKEVVK